MLDDSTDLLACLETRLQGWEGARETMPPAFYTSHSILDRERREVMERQWLCVGRVEQVAGPGDYFVTTVLDEPLLVVRGDDHAVRVLSNVCRHRSGLIATGSGNQSTFVCGYHGWSYARDGSLRRAPLMDGVPGFDASRCRLPSFAHALWNGFIFVNLSGCAAPLAPRLAAMDQRLRGRDLGERRLVHAAREIWETNWKCLMENFLEGYHLSVTHPRTLHDFTPTRLCRKFPGGDLFTGYLAHYDEAKLAGSIYEQGASPEDSYSVLFGVFPTFLITVAPRYGFYLYLQPDGPQRVEVTWGVFARPGFEGSDEAKDYAALVARVNEEDRLKLEGQQCGLRSRRWTPAPLAPDDLEGTIGDFHRYLAGRLCGSSKAGERISA